MGLVRRVRSCLVLSAALMAVLSPFPISAWDGYSPGAFPGYGHAMPVQWPAQCSTGPEPCMPMPPPACVPFKDYFLKLAYGRTFGTSTILDYATLELSKPLSRSPVLTVCGPAWAEVQMALLGSYVLYSEGVIERAKKLNFADGYELAWLPKGRFVFTDHCWGMNPYLESGAGLSYVSETYRNSGSRWNWSFLGGFGVEKCLPGGGALSLGLQWRHLSNGNMWGKGDELHNSNSGTDMVQGLATFLHRF